MQPTAKRDHSRLYHNALLSVIAGLLGVIAFDNARPGASMVSTASAQPTGSQARGDEDQSTGLVSASEQRKVIITELRDQSSRLDRIESALKNGLSVRVTEMPAVVMRDGESARPTRERDAGGAAPRR